MSTSTDLGATWDTGNATAGEAGGGGEGSAKAPLHMAGLPFSGTGWHGLPGLFWGLGAAVHIPGWVPGAPSSSGTQRVLLQFGNLTSAKGGCDDGVLQEYGPRQIESTDAVSISRPAALATTFCQLTRGWQGRTWGHSLDVQKQIPSNPAHGCMLPTADASLLLRPDGPHPGRILFCNVHDSYSRIVMLSRFACCPFR